MKQFIIDGSSLRLPDLRHIAEERQPVTISASSRRAMAKSRKLVEQWIAQKENVYGVTTGFGELSSVRIDPKQSQELQENLILSHAAGAGDPLPREVVRAMMTLRINALAKGFSGIRPETVDLLVRMLNKDLIPFIPSQGSVGASGDLVQLSHLVLAMIGKGKILDGTSVLSASKALKKAGLSPIRLTAKEGLALINGTQMMTAFTGLAAEHARELVSMADAIAALSVEALRGSDTAFDERIHQLRPYKGQLTSARNLRMMMRGSDLRESHRHNDTRVQDAYSLRCIPQVHGASRDAIEYVHSVLSVEINSANDNPLIFPDSGTHLEGGNFHGQPIALAADFLAIALAELANISERRTERMVNSSLSGLPKFLSKNGGLHSGFMIAQYTAASLVSENKVLSHPGSVDSIPTSANQEDHNSMGSVSAQKAWRVLKNVKTVLAIELLCACQALDFARLWNSTTPLKAGRGTERLYELTREHISFLDRDPVLHDDIDKALRIVESGEILRRVHGIIDRP